MGGYGVEVVGFVPPRNVRLQGEKLAFGLLVPSLRHQGPCVKQPGAGIVRLGLGALLGQPLGQLGLIRVVEHLGRRKGDGRALELDPRVVRVSREQLVQIPLHLPELLAKCLLALPVRGSKLVYGQHRGRHRRRVVDVQGLAGEGQRGLVAAFLAQLDERLG